MNTNAPWNEGAGPLPDPVQEGQAVLARYLAWIDAARAKVKVGNATQEERLGVAYHDNTVESFMRRFEQRLIHGEKRPPAPMPTVTVASVTLPPLASEFDGVPGYGLAPRH